MTSNPTWPHLQQPMSEITFDSQHTCLITLPTQTLPELLNASCKVRPTRVSQKPRALRFPAFNKGRQHASIQKEPCITCHIKVFSQLHDWWMRIRTRWEIAPPHHNETMEISGTFRNFYPDDAEQRGSCRISTIAFVGVGSITEPSVITRLINSNDHDGDDNDAIRHCPSPRTIFHLCVAFLHLLVKYENTNFAVNWV